MRHNNRDFLTRNVDKDRIGDNIIYKQQTIAEAYECLFGDAQREYNAKQKRKDRQIDDYFKKLFGREPTDEIVKGGVNGKQFSFYEYVIGLGDKDDTGFDTNPEAAALSIQCQKDFMEGNKELGIPSFQERNPNLYLANAITHCDEKTPHTHFDVIPFSDGYKRGMSRQQGIDKALETMGYGSNGAEAIAAWTRHERDIFRQICEFHGFEIAQEEKGRGFSFTVQEYKQHKELERKISEEENELADLKTETEAAKAERDVAKAETEDYVRSLNPEPTKTSKTIFGKERVVEKSEEEQQRDRDVAAAQAVLKDKDDVAAEKKRNAQEREQIQQDRANIAEYVQTLDNEKNRALDEQRKTFEGEIQQLKAENQTLKQRLNEFIAERAQQARTMALAIKLRARLELDKMLKKLGLYAQFNEQLEKGHNRKDEHTRQAEQSLTATGDSERER
ncbi:MAG: plasmid recombination protein [Lachnospiraceae bacterium]|nr:plasmid recombination protein [Ruminococcus sp.]MCM1277041.1 plasmid recombination protein [Lachnospiraceae bacterium]